MAESRSMTTPEVVAKTLIDEHSDFMREAVAIVAREIMEAEISGQIGALRGEISAERSTHRNGYRERLWETRVGEIELQVPRKRSGTAYFPSFLEPRRPCEQAIERILGCPWQRCTVHFVRNMHGHCRRSERGLVSAALREIFDAPDLGQAKERLGSVLERFQHSVPKVAELLEAAEEDLLAFYRFPASHWRKLRSTNPLERVNKEIGRRSDVVGIFPNDASAIRLVGALLIEQNDEWLVGRRYLSAESLAPLLEERGDEEDEEVIELRAA